MFSRLCLHSGQQQSTGRRFSASPGSSDSAIGNSEELRPGQVVKEFGYLIDNLCCCIISRRRSEIKEKVGGPEDSSRNGKCKVREPCAPDGARRSIAVASRGFPPVPGLTPKNGVATTLANERSVRGQWGFSSCLRIPAPQE